MVPERNICETSMFMMLRFTVPQLSMVISVGLPVTLSVRTGVTLPNIG